MFSKIRLNRARSVLISPQWDGESVVYDCRAGDLWVLSGLGRRLVEVLREAGPTCESDIVRACLDGERAEVTEAEVVETLEDLAAHGILERLAP